MSEEAVIAQKTPYQIEAKVSRFFRIRKLSIQYFYPSAADFAKLMQG